MPFWLMRFRRLLAKPLNKLFSSKFIARSAMTVSYASI
jgi:hypothetical protein